MAVQGDQYIKSNYLCNCFYNEEVMNSDGERGEIYLFYRQGHTLIINANDISKYVVDDITEYELGSMFLIYNTILMVRSQTSLNFYKIEVNQFTEVREWKLYHQLETRGFIDFTPGNIRFQLTT